ncbi:MAG: indolepyruvate oxidoreductase subunit beta [Acidobacteriota bacterium]|nr:indolepyruvate oxidoreductase subunit beta [Acidobacteriota bacterium]
MKQDIILAGVGGQGILSIAYVIDNAALEEGLQFKQAEVHGMSQRGGAVQSHLRISDGLIFSDLIPRGEADLILSVEPLECLRYFEYLGPEAVVVTSLTPYVNIPDYPDMEKVLTEIRRAPKSFIVDSERIAGEAGTSKAQNMVMLGAASNYLKVGEESLRRFIEVLFRARGAHVVEVNLKAFELGRRAGAES